MKPSNPFNAYNPGRKARKAWRLLKKRNNQQDSELSEVECPKPKAAEFHDGVLNQFGRVPCVVGSLKSLVQTVTVTETMKRTQTVATVANQQSTEMKPPVSESLRPVSTSIQSASDPSQSVKISENEHKSEFPDLIIFKGFSKFGGKGTQFLKRSFLDSPYGSLTTVKEKSENPIKVSVWACGKRLAEGQGPTQTEAEHDAMYSLLAKLRTTNYYIELKDNYNTRKRFPDYLLTVDPSQSHIYKVVYLRREDGSPFPYDIQGAVDYVSSFAELSIYIKNLGNTGSKADLFILNIDKSQRPEIYKVCSEIGMKARPLLGCSNRGVVAEYLLTGREVFQQLISCGGDTIKYHLYPPGSECSIIAVKEKDDELARHLSTEKWSAEQLRIRKRV
uniref:Uncharacterized protein n=2 Tax=Graphocephala atropunctata TaxID=36148 RepID=A0A1B6LF73_9HEMI